jgi:hypothetical protein
MPSRPSRQSEPIWRKSSFSADQGNCVEIASEGRSVLMRDSRDPGAILAFSVARWSAFMRRIRADDGLSASR